MIKEIDPGVGILIEQNDGYCCCALVRTDDTGCPCRDFREMEEGICNCGRYEKVKE